MAEPPRNSAVLVFDEFLAYLRQQGFIIGVDHYLRLQELLNKISGECGPAELGSMLCPIFATSQNQQEKFYRAFSTFFALLQSSPASTPGDARDSEQSGQSDRGLEQSADGAAWKKVASWSVVLGVVLASAFYFLVMKPGATQNQNSNTNQQDNQNANTNANRGANSNSANRTEPVTNSNDRGTGNKNDNPVPVANTDPNARPNVSKPSPQPLLGPTLRSFIRTAATGSPILLFLIYEYLRHKRRKLVLQKQRAKKPPFVYALRIEPPAHKIFNSEQFYTAARRMRRRQTDKFHRLDVSATVDATTRSLGYPSFRYKPGSKIPEYLVLIDRASFRDHQAQLFGNLVRALNQEGLYVTSYFYDGDPRICCSVKGEYSQLSELQNKHADDRLLIFGDGDKLIDPLTGELEPWTSAFLYWPDRGILTPEAPNQWGLRESSIATQFALVPANLNGLLEVVDYFENGATIDPHLLTKNGHGSLPGELGRSAAIEELRNYLGEKTFQWLCACAVYPELQWGLTLYLGSLPCMDEDLIKEESLRRLASVPWFRSGAIPDEIRLSLIRELDKEKERAIRSAIIELLEHAPTARRPQVAFAADSYELNLAVESWFYQLDDRHRTRLRRVIVKLPQKEVFRDYTLIRFLESAPRTQLALLLPKKLRAIFYPSAMPEFGLRTGARLVLAAISIAVIWFGLNWLMPPLSKAKILDFSASQKTIAAGDKVNLFYGVSNANAARINPQPGDVEVLEENVIEVAPSETTTYSLTAMDSDKRIASRQLTIEVVGEGDLRIALLSVSPQTIASGQTASLCYEVREATAVQINSESDQVYSNRFTDTHPLDKNCIQVAPSQTTAYTLIAMGKDGKQATQTVTLNVVAPDAVRIDSFNADPPIINEGGKSKLCYQATNATGGAQVVSNFGEMVSVRNNCATVTPKVTTIYTLKATGPNGPVEQSLTVTVVLPDKPVIDEFTATPSVVDAGGKVQFCYRVRNASVINMGIEIGTGQGERLYSERNSSRRTCINFTASWRGAEPTIIYVLEATSANGTAAFAKLTVAVKPNPLQISEITVLPSTVIAGETAVLCTKVVGGTRPFSVTVNPFGVSMSPFGAPDQACGRITPTETTKITVTATDVSGQTATGQITVEVQQPTPPRIISFTANPSVVAPGEQVKLCYEVENADGVTMSAGAEKISRLIKATKGYKTVLITAQQGPQPASRQFVKGSKNCIPVSPTRTTTYTVEATNDSGKADTKSVVVTVQEPAPRTERNADSNTGGSGLTSGALFGGVFDTSGKPVPDATVTATNRVNGYKVSAKTDKNGQFRFGLLRPGTYIVTASMRGYSSTTITIMVDIGRANFIRQPDITLRKVP